MDEPGEQAMLKITTNGVLHGDRVDLERSVHELPDGAEVSVTITQRELSLEEKRKLIDRLCGAWADDPTIPGVFEEILRERQSAASRDVSFDDPS